MPLWLLWWSALQMVRPAFSRLRTFLWFATAVAGFTVRTELSGVTSIVRALKFRPKCYENLIRNLHSAYYAARKIANGLLEQNNHLITRVKSNAVAYAPYVAQGAKKRGRPRLYGRKIALRTLINDTNGMQQAQSPVYGDQKVTLNYLVRDLLWRPMGQLVRFVVVLHPSRGSILLMSTDTSLSAIDIIRTYGLRFK